MRRYVMMDAETASLGSDDAVRRALEQKGFDFSRQFTRFRPTCDDRVVFEQGEHSDDALVVSLRALVGAMHGLLCGAYGANDSYAGQYENEVQAVAAALRQMIRARA
jgi:hypothetical protein